MKEKLSVVVEKQQPKDVFYADETGSFFKPLPDSTMSNNKNCRGRKHSKKNIYILYHKSEWFRETRASGGGEISET